MGSSSRLIAGTRLRQWAHLEEGQDPPEGFDDLQEWRDFEIPFKGSLMQVRHGWPTMTWHAPMLLHPDLLLWGGSSLLRITELVQLVKPGLRK